VVVFDLYDYLFRCKPARHYDVESLAGDSAFKPLDNHNLTVRAHLLISVKLARAICVAEMNLGAQRVDVLRLTIPN